MARALVDTGAIVALVNRSDRHHARAAEWFASVRGGLLTTEAVVTETAYLLAAAPEHQRAALHWVQRVCVAGMMAARAVTHVALVGMLACTAGGCYTRLASLHPATDITDASADGDHVYLPDSYDDPRDSAYRDSRAYGNYPEDRYLDPYLSGFTYSDRYGSGTSGNQIRPFTEIALYTVHNGQISEEQYFYD